MATQSDEATHLKRNTLRSFKRMLQRGGVCRTARDVTSIRRLTAAFPALKLTGCRTNLINMCLLMLQTQNYKENNSFLMQFSIFLKGQCTKLI